MSVRSTSGVPSGCHHLGLPAWAELMGWAGEMLIYRHLQDHLQDYSTVLVLVRRIQMTGQYRKTLSVNPGDPFGIYGRIYPPGISADPQLRLYALQYCTAYKDYYLL